MSDDLPEIGRLEVGDDVRVEYRSRRSGNTVEREGEVSEIHGADPRSVYVHDERQGFWSHTFVALVSAETTEGNDAVAAISVSTEPDTPSEDPPDLGAEEIVKHRVARKSTLGVVEKVIRPTPGSLTPNDVL